MNEDQNLGEITDQLKRLRPAPASLDANVVFYNAGRSAGKSQVASRGAIRIAPLIAAGLLAAAVTAPTSYRVGWTAAMGVGPATENVVAEIDATEPKPAAAQQAPAPEPAADQPKPSSDRMKRPLLARWIDPYGTFTQLPQHDLQPGTTLAVFHSSIVSRQNMDQLSIDFPVTPMQTGPGRWGGPHRRRGSEIASPLAVSDFSQLTRSLETDF